ncbi:MAG: hypothetical protein ACKVQA_08065 [Burkholderiales bacterium]
MKKPITTLAVALSSLVATQAHAYCYYEYFYNGWYWYYVWVCR